MANVLTSQVILDGDRLAILKFTGLIDTAETAVVKVNVANLASYGALACTGCKLNKVWSYVYGCEVELQWEASLNLMIVNIPQQSNYLMDFSSFGGIPNNSSTGKTGNILFTTRDVSAGDSYAIVLEVIKTYG